MHLDVPTGLHGVLAQRVRVRPVRHVTAALGLGHVQGRDQHPATLHSGHIVRPLLGPRKRRNQEGGQHRDDGDDQQLNQGKALLEPTPSVQL